MARHLIKSDTAIRTAKPDVTPRLKDGDGLYLLLKPGGSHWWRLDYSIGGKRKTLSLGTYPDTGLKAARDKAVEARQQVAAGIDPSDLRKASKAEQAKVLEADKRLANGQPAVGSFEEVAREWFAKFSAEWAASHSSKIIRRLECDVFPWLGKMPIAEIEAMDVLQVLRRIEERGALDTAHRAHQNCGQIFRYAIATGRAKRNPCPDLRGALPAVKQTGFAAIIEPKAIGELLRAIDAYQGYFVTQCALRLAPLVFVRPGELRHAEWAEIDLDKAEWNIPASKMKMREAHLDDVRAIVEEWVLYLREDKLWGNDDPLFPATLMECGSESRQFEVAGLNRKGWGSASPIRTIFREAFESTGLQYFNPHSFRDTVVHLGETICKSPEDFKAWSQNLGHEQVLTTFLSYGEVAPRRQGEIIQGLGKPRAPAAIEPDVQALAKALMREMRDSRKGGSL